MHSPCSLFFVFVRTEPLATSFAAAVQTLEYEYEGGNQDISERILETNYLKVLEDLQNATIPHQCFTGVSKDPVTDHEHPHLRCDFTVPFGLNVTAEIKDGSCESFSELAKSDFFTNGYASAIFLPKITESEKRLGSFIHNYCARLDIIMHDGVLGLQSVFERRFVLQMQFDYKKNEDEVSDDFTVAMANENEDVESGPDIGLIFLVLACGIVGGSIITITLVAIIQGNRKKSARTQNEAELSDAEATVVPDENLFV